MENSPGFKKLFSYRKTVKIRDWEEHSVFSKWETEDKAKKNATNIIRKQANKTTTADIF